MTDKHNEFDRRKFMVGAVGAAAAVGALGADAAATAPAEGAGGATAAQPGGPPARSSDATLSTLQQAQPRLYRLEGDVHDCEVTGKIPTDLNGAFYRVGPDAQYPMAPGNIPFDGEGHVSMFRIKDGRVHYRSRFVRNERYLAQEKAGRILFPMYRNPATDDPSVKGVSRSTANTHIINHRNLLLSLKEDSPPSALDLLTLETVAPTYTFDGQLPSKTFTAHPKLDSHTGNMVAFGYESEGHGSDVVTMFEFTPQGRKVWDAKIQVPYVGMLHDFAVTENYIVFYVIPMAIDQAQMDRGGIHWSWDGTQADVLRFRAPRRRRQGCSLDRRADAQRDARHGRVRRRQSSSSSTSRCRCRIRSRSCRCTTARAGIRSRARATSRGSPSICRSAGRRHTASSRCTRTSVRCRGRTTATTRVPYRYGFLGCPDPNAAPGTGGACYCALRSSEPHLDAVQRRHGDVAGRECVSRRRARPRPKASGYLMGLATRNSEGGRADLVILDAERLQTVPSRRYTCRCARRGRCTAGGYRSGRCRTA